ncbi:hypothetical protein BDY24DRAFT_414507 [Mrakia frigida]|uniref:uncharacterized protein n=1 Tax=Mrakia frigida TaxID=29902 RepID=UPI003FCC19DB
MSSHLLPQQKLPNPDFAMPLFSPPPPPPLPTELKKHVLHFCDPPTLAATSLLSLQFLELSSPLLYDEIEITGFEVDSSHQPQLEPYLSIVLIRSLTVTPATTDDPTVVPPFSRHRLVRATEVEIDSLTIVVCSPSEELSREMRQRVDAMMMDRIGSGEELAQRKALVTYEVRLGGRGKHDASTLLTLLSIDLVL